jgi:hypothetical protein
MSKKRSVAHNYRHKKDKLEISIENYSLGKEQLREASKDGQKGKRVNDPIKESRLPQVGD